jgi:L-threonylcarbamoyladenylate synthase
MATSVIRIEDEDDLKEAIDFVDAYLRSGGIIIYPTDTVYGIGCDANSRDAIAKVHAIKGGDPAKPLSVMVASLGMIDEYCETGLWDDIILRKYLPGPYTFLLKSRGLCPASANEKLGVRIPDSLFCQGLCAKFGRPIVTTSANLAGQAPPAKFGDIDGRVLEQVGIAVDAGLTKHGGPSAIIDLVEKKYIREGGQTINLDEI